MDQARPPTPAITPRHAVLITGLVLLLLTQFALPALLLLRPRPQFVGWQMYSSTKPDIQLSLVASDGALTPLSLKGYIGRNRREIDYAASLPPLVCERNPDAAGVQVTMGDQQWVYLCN